MALTIRSLLCSALALAGLSACGRAPLAPVAAPAALAPAPASVRQAAPVAPRAAAPAPAAAAVGALIANNGAAALPTFAAFAGVPSGQSVIKPEFAAIASLLLAGEDAEEEPAPAPAAPVAQATDGYDPADYTPQALAITGKSAKSLTITWFTEKPTRAIVEFGRIHNFEQYGYTHLFKDEVAKTAHTVTVTDLKRFSRYRIRVTAVTALGLPFAGAPQDARTKLLGFK